MKKIYTPRFYICKELMAYYFCISPNTPVELDYPCLHHSYSIFYFRNILQHKNH